MLTRAFLLIITISILLLQGCVAVQPFPSAARAGETVTLAVGSIDGMTRSNTTINYIPDSDPLNPILIPSANIRGIIPIYPDKKTHAWTVSAAVFIDNDSGHGAWLTVLVIDLPATLLQGTGKFDIQTAGVSPPLAGNVNNVEISFEVLQGLGVANPFDYYDPTTDLATTLSGDLLSLEPFPYYLFKPDSGQFWPKFAAIQLTIQGDVIGSSEAIINKSMKVVLEDMEENLNSNAQMDWVRNGSTTTVNIISTLGKLNYFEARTAIFFNNADINFATLPTVTAKYFDVEGNEVSGPVIKMSYVTN